MLRKVSALAAWPGHTLSNRVAITASNTALKPTSSQKPDLQPKVSKTAKGPDFNARLLTFAACLSALAFALVLPFANPFANLFPSSAPGSFKKLEPIQTKEALQDSRKLFYALPSNTIAAPRVVEITVPVGARVGKLEFVFIQDATQSNQRLSEPGKQQKADSEFSSKTFGNHYLRAAVPDTATTLVVSLSNECLLPLYVALDSGSKVEQAILDKITLTTSLLCSQLLLACFGFVVARFGKIRAVDYFSWWLLASSAVTLTASRTFSHFFPFKLAAVIEPHLLGLAASMFALATIRLKQGLEGKTDTRFNTQAQWWLNAWFMALGASTAFFPHPFLLGLLWTSIALFCVGTAAHYLKDLRSSPSKLVLCFKASAWFIGGANITLEMLPWFGLTGASSGFGFLIPTISTATFTGFTLARAVNLERSMRRDSQKRAELSLNRVAEVLENTPIAMLSANLKGRIVNANGQARELWPSMDWSKPEKLRLDDLMGKEYAGILSSAFKSKHSVEAILNLPKGVQRSEERICQLKLFRTSRSLELTLVDITDQERMTKVLESQVNSDPLTKLLNRRGLDQHLRALQSLVNRNEAQGCLLFIDLDRFKIVNDLYGHDYGDELLVQIAIRGRAMSEGRLTIARVGGDEFVVIVPNVGLSAACELAEELRGVISNRPYPVKDKLLTVGASIGVVTLIKGMEPKDALTYADRACGQAKKNGRGKVETIEASDRLLNELKTESELQQVMTHRLPIDHLRIYAQPIVPLNGRSNLAYEILVRYVDENGNVLAPGQLISIAERQGMMSQLDKWVLESTLKFLDANQRFARNSLFFTVNLSGSSINDRRFLSDIMQLFDQYPHLADRVILEVTETVALLDTKYTRRFMDTMIAKGVRFALDDFGAGYTSFGYLKDLPANMLKIDGAFIAPLSKDSSCQRIVKTISTLSQQLAMQSVAEWVEDAACLQMLVAMNIDFAQGFYFSPAKPAEFWLTGEKAIEAILAKADRYTRVSPTPAPKEPTTGHARASLEVIV